jgi:hypothetical protein
MAYFGMDFLGGSKTKVGKAEMGSQYSGGFARGEQEAFGDVGSARATGEEQRRLAEALRAQAEGRTPSLAAMQYASALEQSQAAAASQLASARGLSPAQAQRLLMTQQSAARAGAAGQSAMMRLQEQQAAQGALANVLMQQRQQSLLGASTASSIGAQAGQLGLAQQQMEQQRIIAEQQIRRQEEAAMEAGVTGALQSATKAGLAFAGKTASKGGEIKGRSQYNGDTRSNDTVPALLSPGEIVLPRSVAQDEDAPEKSKKFVEAIKKQKKPAGKASIAAALARIQELEARLNAMEALADLEAEEQG